MRRLGGTGLTVSPVTLGTGSLARSPSARAVAAHALDAGITAVELDAADEAALATLDRGLFAGRDLAVFARATSLVPFDLPSPHLSVQDAYPGAHLRAEVDRLLRRLGVDRIGVLQLHAWCAEWLHEGDWREETERLRAEGKIAAVGVSLFDGDADAALDAVDSGAIGAVEVMFNLFDTGAATRLLPLARERDAGVIARSPLYYGTLVEHPREAFAADDWRGSFFFPAHRDETLARARRIRADLAAGESLTEAALRFALSHPVVSTAAVGLRTVAQVDQAIAAARCGPLPPEQLRHLFAHRWLC